jgi:hypothetical protein
MVMGAVLPHLSEILAVLPTVARRCLTLLVRGRPVSPRIWLVTGGAPEPVMALAETLGEQGVSGGCPVGRTADRR